MNTYTLQVRWLQSTETVFFDPEEPIRRGQIIRTTEKWDDYLDPIEYRTHVLEWSQTDAEYTLKLLYSETDNPIAAALNDAWGTSTLSFNVKARTATAEWKNNAPNEGYDGFGKAKIFIESLTENLGFVSVQRRKRRQDKLKQALLKLGPKCAVSGETATEALEAAHIMEVKENGGHSVRNGILLRADIHQLFDRGHISINPNGTVAIGKDIPESSKYHQEAKDWEVEELVMTRIAKALRNRTQR